MKDVFTLERKVKIPADRHISLNWDFEVPETVPEGEVSVILKFPARDNRAVVDFPAADDAEDDGEAATEYLMHDAANREYLLKAIDDVEHGRNLVSVPADMFKAIDAVLSAAK